MDNQDLYLKSPIKAVITLYIRPSTSRQKVLDLLKHEQPIISNIKSTVTRKGIQVSFQRIKTFVRRMPKNKNGYILVASPDRLVYTDEMFIIADKYSCGSEFYSKPYEKELISRLNPVGIIVLDTKEATIGYVDSQIEVIKTITSGISGKHHKGGFSQQRFKRKREEEINNFFKRVAEVTKVFLISHPIDSIIISGPGLTKDRFLKGKYLDPKLKEKVIGTFDTQYTGEYGLQETLKIALERIQKNAFAKEVKIVEDFFNILGKHFDKVLYGEEEISLNIHCLNKLIKIQEHQKEYPFKNTTILYFHGEHYEKIKGLGGVVGIKRS